MLESDFISRCDELLKFVAPFSPKSLTMITFYGTNYVLPKKINFDTQNKN